MGTKRNIKALKRLRAVFRKVPAHQVHMKAIFHHASCGTVGCLWGHGRRDPVLRAMPGFTYDFSEVHEFLGLTERQCEELFLSSWIRPSVLDALLADPHAISKAQVMDRLDSAIAGKPIKPYVVAKAS
jgi:hypothetical protein